MPDPDPFFAIGISGRAGGFSCSLEVHHESLRRNYASKQFSSFFCPSKSTGSIADPYSFTTDPDPGFVNPDPDQDIGF